MQTWPPAPGGLRAWRVLGHKRTVPVVVARSVISTWDVDRGGVASVLVATLERRGHRTLVHGALSETERNDWAWASEATARDVAQGRAEQGVVCCWTGTGASIAANKVDGVRAALCLDGAELAGGEADDAVLLLLDDAPAGK